MRHDYGEKALSIIIPVYNVEQYIEKCLESVVHQIKRDNRIEVIIVNDGTPDNSIKRIEHFAKRENINIFHQKNLGLSAARNTGLKNAKGKYIAFLDSDDFLEQGALAPLLEESEKELFDVIHFNYSKYYNRDLIIKNNKFPECLQYETGKDFYTKVVLEDKYIPMVWCYLYRRSLLRENKLTFVTGILHEDCEFTPRVLSKAKKVLVKNSMALNYRQRKNSIHNTMKYKNREDRIFISQRIWALKSENKKWNLAINIDSVGGVLCAFNKEPKKITSEQLNKLLKKTAFLDLKTVLFKKNKLKYKIAFLFLKTSPKLLLNFYHWYRVYKERRKKIRFS